jgi:hypothetical protein
LPMSVATAAARAGPAAVALAPPLPQNPIIAQGVSSANPAHLVRNRAWDFAEMAKTFNTVALLPGDPSAVRDASAAGMSVILELDYKSYFFAGQDISAKIDAVAQQIMTAPGTVVAIDVADRINEKHSPAEALRYLAATAGVLHREVPGIPVVVNAADWQLTCGRPNQSSCDNHDPRFKYETDKVLDTLYQSGYVDGFLIADNLKNEDLQAQRAAWAEARTRWPAPFILWSTCSQLSFPGDRYRGTSDSAARSAQAWMAAPMAGGADGLALWAWHQTYDGAVYSFLDKNGAGNSLWTAMVAAARGIRQGSADGLGPGGVPPLPTQVGPAVAATGHGGSSIGIGVGSVIGFAVILGVLVAGVAARLRQRTRWQAPPGAGSRAHLPRHAGQRSEMPSTWR